MLHELASSPSTLAQCTHVHMQSSRRIYWTLDCVNLLRMAAPVRVYGLQRADCPKCRFLNESTCKRRCGTFGPTASGRDRTFVIYQLRVGGRSLLAHRTFTWAVTALPGYQRLCHTARDPGSARAWSLSVRALRSYPVCMEEG
jgi:hypothetical protein